MTAKRFNIYFRNAELHRLFRLLIAKHIIPADSLSQRIEMLVLADVRKVLPRMRKANITIPEFVFEGRPTRNYRR